MLPRKAMRILESVIAHAVLIACGLAIGIAVGAAGYHAQSLVSALIRWMLA